jgi:hypothetical protein
VLTSGANAFDGVTPCFTAFKGVLKPLKIDVRHPPWHEFGRLISGYGGWGMRIEVVPEDETHRRPKGNQRTRGAIEVCPGDEF